MAFGLHAWKGAHTVLHCDHKDGVVIASLQTKRLFSTRSFDLPPGSLLGAELQESSQLEDGAYTVRTKAVLKTTSGPVPLSLSPDGFSGKSPRDAVNQINAFVSNPAAAPLTVEQDQRGQWALWAGLMLAPGLWLLFKGGH